MKNKNTSIDFPVYLFHQGTAQRAYEIMGAHPDELDGAAGYTFRVFAPNAAEVYLAGEFNEWSRANRMKKITDQGIWEVFVAGVKEYASYKYIIEDQEGNCYYKADPYGYLSELRPATASKTFCLDNYSWNDQVFCANRSNAPYGQAMSIYEVHFGSWRKYKDGNFFDYHKMADELIPYVVDLGYTHIELMPMSEYPYDGSWGYQVIGYYAATSRYGTPGGFMAFIDRCHQAGLGVILDWVPGHFPKDEAGLYRFDGTACYEYEDALKNEHKDWGTMIFDWGKNEVKSFLISNAVFWFEKFHVDGLRVDAVASMLYLDYGRQSGEWRPNQYGGHENLEAILFLKELNKAVFENFPHALMIAEESTAWPMVTRPIEDGGLGFNFKWNMGWMNDTLLYMKQDPLFRSGYHNHLTFAMTYIFSENFLLPLSHDEVVHMKGSLIHKMPGTYEEKFLNLRAYLTYMMMHPGKKLLFMGSELPQFAEWNYEAELDWNLLEFPMHQKFHLFIKELNHFYRQNDELWALDDNWRGFSWVNADDKDNNILSFIRRNKEGDELLIISNFSPVEQQDYMLSPDEKNNYKLVFTSADEKYGGKNHRSKTITGGCGEIPGLSTSVWVKF